MISRSVEVEVSPPPQPLSFEGRGVGGEGEPLKLSSPYKITPILLTLTILGGFLRFYQIGSKGLWLDEAFSVWMGWHSISEMLGWLIKVDQHPPLYYALLHIWMNLGDNATIVRAFSAVMSTLTIPVVYLLGRRLAGWRVGWLAALLITFAPYHIRFAQETRMYALLTFNASMALLALSHLLTEQQASVLPFGQQLRNAFRLWRNNRTTGAQKSAYVRTDAGWVRPPKISLLDILKSAPIDLAWLGYIGATVATLLTHNTAVFFPIAVNLLVFGLIWLRKNDAESPYRLYAPNRQNWLTAQIVIVLLWSPWLAAFIAQSMDVYNRFWIPPADFGRVIWTIKQLLSPFLPSQISFPAVIWALYGLLFLFGLWHFRRYPARLLLLLLLIIVPFAGELIVSIQRPIFYDRTLIWTTIPIFLLMAAGISQLKYRSFVTVVVLMVLTINGLSLREYYQNFQKEQWDVAAQFVADRVTDDDMILFNATWVQIPFDFYFRDFNRNVAEYGTPVNLFDRGILEPQMTPADVPRLQSLARAHNRVWLIYSHNWYTDPTGIVSSALETEKSLLEIQSFNGLEIHLYGQETR